MKKLFLFLFLSSLTWMVSGQQESSFSHYMYNHQAINPGYVGARGVANFTSVLRSQWTGIEGAPLTQTLSYSGPVSTKNIGFGLSVINDKIGPISNTSFNIDLAYHLRLNRNDHRLAVGLKAGVLNYVLNPDMINTFTPNDQAFILDQDRKLLPNVGFGFYYYTPKFYLGAAIPQMIAHEAYQLERHFLFDQWGFNRVFREFHVETQYAF